MPLADVEEGATVRILRFENEAEDLLHYLKDTGLTPGLEGVLARAGDDEVVVEAGEVKHAVTRSVAETVWSWPTLHRRPAPRCRNGWCWAAALRPLGRPPSGSAARAASRSRRTRLSPRVDATADRLQAAARRQLEGRRGHAQ